ncbi:unnamed protein product [Paramecium primaurelia]|uniref:Uncharacterized protein n=1 Tax=Paramecium primaurelia TaxID=5886 RepID=A0A8S1P992_PARPR|nr:unnamed protein product [Paramecium primaurelia]
MFTIPYCQEYIPLEKLYLMIVLQSDNSKNVNYQLRKLIIKLFKINANVKNLEASFQSNTLTTQLFNKISH